MVSTGAMVEAMVEAATATGEGEGVVRVPVVVEEMEVAFVMCYLQGAHRMALVKEVEVIHAIG